MEVKEFEVHVKSLSFGIEDIVLDFDGEEIAFCASYIGHEPLSSLIESLVGLEESVDNVDYTHYFIKWLDEPGEIKFELNKDKFHDRLEIIIHYDNEVEDENNKKFKKSYIMPFTIYKKAILKEALTVLQKYGLNGFCDSWADGKDIFPICSLISLIGAKTKYDKKEDNFKSDIITELKVLIDALKEK